MAGVVSAFLGGRPRFLGTAGVDGATVDASEISALLEDDEEAAVRRAGVGAPTVELRETLASLREGPRRRGSMLELHASEAAYRFFLDGGIVSDAFGMERMGS